MPEVDIRQHILSASRGNTNDLMTALNDINSRLETEESKLPVATAAQIQSGASNVTVTPSALYAAYAPVTLTDAASVAVNMAAGSVFVLSFTDNRTVANPTGHTVGQSGEFWVMNFAGAKELTWDTFYDFVGTPTTAQGVGAWSCVRYRVVSAGSIMCTMQNT